MTLSLIVLLVLAEPAQTSPPEGTAELMLAARVADWARRTGDADAMIVAADLVRAHSGAAPAGAEGDIDVGDQALFDEAAALAPDVEAAARVATHRAIDPRGVARALGADGPIGRLMLIAPGRPLTFSLTARGSEQALLHVGPTGGGDLQVTIQDDRGQTQCSERAPARPVLCNWRPTFTTTYRVSIRVVSAVPVTTVITSN
ncbi:MAG: hypothetical protein KKA16_07835 [Alphaproteobacteria bacterium]|nr:hypothetical protein [Alphaproteobacteria bacterium]MBU2378954.1 hypothetical protein [Alphaproteobacteria bacterium]